LLGPDARPARGILLEAVLGEKTALGTRLHAARALGGLRDDAEVIVPKMVELLGRPAKGYDRANNCQAATETLGLLGSKARAAVPALRKVLDDEENEAVDAARRALERIAKD
jgi:HEAT repeat protein